MSGSSLSHPIIYEVSEAYKNLSSEPLKVGDDFYTDLSQARSSRALKKLEKQITRVRRKPHKAHHFGFVGHKGSGKSTELNQLQDRLKKEFLVCHLYLDGSLQNDCDYPELFLWMVEDLVKELIANEIKPNSQIKKAIERISSWYEETTKLEVEANKTSVSVEGEIEAKASTSFFGNGYKAMLKLKSALSGSHEFRTESRQKVKQRFEELLTLMNTLLLLVDDLLGERSLLIIQDNLDRLDRDSALRIFQENGSILKRLQGCFLWTLPVGQKVAPFNIAHTFDTDTFMPTISVKERDGTPNSSALEGLKNLLAKRLNLQRIFVSDEVIESLILYSGGSVRDLLKLADEATTNADLEDRLQVIQEDVDRAAKDMALGFQSSLFPHTTYFKLLAQTHHSKVTETCSIEGLETDSPDKHRELFFELIVSGALFVYNGDTVWYDVHPVLHTLPDFVVAKSKLHPRE